MVSLSERQSTRELALSDKTYRSADMSRRLDRSLADRIWQLEIDRENGIIKLSAPDGTESLPAWLPFVTSILGNLVSLPEDWHPDGSLPLSDDAVAAALELLINVPEGMPQPSLHPSLDGNIDVEWHTMGFDLGIECTKGRHYITLFEDHIEPEDWEDESDINGPRMNAALQKVADRSSGVRRA